MVSISQILLRETSRSCQDKVLRESQHNVLSRRVLRTTTNNAVMTGVCRFGQKDAEQLRIMKKISYIALLFCLIPMTSGAAELAKVGDTVITTEQYESALKALGNQGLTVASTPELRKRFLDHMINSRLVAGLAKQEGFEKDPLYQSRLADMTNQLLAGEYMDRTLDKKMTDGAVRKYFEEHRPDFSKKEIRASHIVLATEDDAKKVHELASKPGADFAELAKTHSKDKTVDLGFFPRGRMTPEIEKAAFATPKGKVHKKPIHSMFGWHVIKVIDEKGNDKVDFAAVQPDVKTKMRSELQEKLIHSLRGKTKVEVNDQQLKEFKLP